ncbi:MULTISPECIES: DUF6223 family protein [Streptomyces]|uniref:Uncharacterized protein n=1 Tax=Streptomyces dengpaensis TaxID=2049881 RepID=A0ABM6T206_9ACTN|nr:MULTISPECIES: DUF6223 family protein [Streptomyces]AVH60676.1 hypothetical protein C4B68_38495 [Streptomyces dengpaensis]PIA98494.1 hypothetical protein B1C81_39900 [Streptomyces sp. HG99]
MPVRLLAAAALLGGIEPAAPVAAHASVQPVAASFHDFSLGRLGASTGALVGLAGVVIAVLALARPAGRLGTAHGSFGAMAAMVAGLISMALGGLVAATADGGIGTGNGLGGAYVAMLVGLIGTALGGLALTKSRRTS